MNMKLKIYQPKFLWNFLCNRCNSYTMTRFSESVSGTSYHDKVVTASFVKTTCTALK